MPNFQDWTASEIMWQMPQARNVLTKHFGPDSVGTAKGAQLRDLAKRKGVDMSVVLSDLNAVSKPVGLNRS